MRGGASFESRPPIIAAAQDAFFGKPTQRPDPNFMFLDALDEAFGSPKARGTAAASDDAAVERYALGTGALCYDPQPSAEVLAELDALAERSACSASQRGHRPRSAGPS